MAQERAPVHHGTVLGATGITKSYGEVQALRGADLQVDTGQIVALLGRNGAGKTTLLSIIAGLLAADEGSVWIGGIDAMADPDRAKTLIGIAPQETGMYPVLSVRQNLEFFCDLAAVERRDRRARVESVAERLGLTELLDRKGNQLSGGEARRLHTACALVHRPKLLMLDEPTVGADVGTRQQLIDAVRAMADEGAAVVYTTHYLPEVEALDADIVIIDDGRILARGTRAELIDDHHLGGLRFTVDGPAPADALAGLDVTTVRGGDVHGAPHEYLAVGDLTMSALLGRFGSSVDRLISVERNQPDLESVFLAVTGSSLGEAEATETPEDAGAGAGPAGEEGS
ncbi:MAG: ABC transporter ATP-binding protein [Actinomycetota bacterium]